MINVVSQVRCHEVNDKEVEAFEYLTIKVKNHYNWDDFVVLEIDGKSYTVKAKDLKAAIDNALNSAKY